MRYARRAGIHIIPIGIAGSDHQTLRDMASDGQTGAFFTPNFHRLAEIHEEVVEYLIEGKMSTRHRLRQTTCIITLITVFIRITTNLITIVFMFILQMLSHTPHSQYYGRSLFNNPNDCIDQSRGN